MKKTPRLITLIIALALLAVLVCWLIYKPRPIQGYNAATQPNTATRAELGAGN